MKICDSFVKRAIFGAFVHFFEICIMRYTQIEHLIGAEMHDANLSKKGEIPLKGLFFTKE